MASNREPLPDPLKDQLLVCANEKRAVLISKLKSSLAKVNRVTKYHSPLIDHWLTASDTDIDNIIPEVNDESPFPFFLLLENGAAAFATKLARRISTPTSTSGAGTSRAQGSSSGLQAPPGPAQATPPDPAQATPPGPAQATPPGPAQATPPDPAQATPPAPAPHNQPPLEPDNQPPLEPDNQPPLEPDNQPPLEPDNQPAHAPENLPAHAPENLPAPAPENLPAPAPENLPAPAPENLPAPAPENLPAPAPENLPAPGANNPPAPHVDPYLGWDVHGVQYPDEFNRDHVLRDCPRNFSLPQYICMILNHQRFQFPDHLDALHVCLVWRPMGDFDQADQVQWNRRSKVNTQMLGNYNLESFYCYSRFGFWRKTMYKMAGEVGLMLIQYQIIQRNVKKVDPLDKIASEVIATRNQVQRIETDLLALIDEINTQVEKM